MGARLRSRRGTTHLPLRPAVAALSRGSLVFSGRADADLDQFRDGHPGGPFWCGDVSPRSALVRRAWRTVMRRRGALRALFLARSLRARRAERVLRIPVLRSGALWLRRFRARRPPPSCAARWGGVRRCCAQPFSGRSVFHAAAAGVGDLYSEARELAPSGGRAPAGYRAERLCVAAGRVRRPIRATRENHAGQPSILQSLPATRPVARYRVGIRKRQVIRHRLGSSATCGCSLGLPGRAPLVGVLHCGGGRVLSADDTTCWMDLGVVAAATASPVSLAIAGDGIDLPGSAGGVAGSADREAGPLALARVCRGVGDGRRPESLASCACRLPGSRWAPLDAGIPGGVRV